MRVGQFFGAALRVLLAPLRRLPEAQSGKSGFAMALPPTRSSRSVVDGSVAARPAPARATSAAEPQDVVPDGLPEALAAAVAANPDLATHVYVTCESADGLVVVALASDEKKVRLAVPTSCWRNLLAREPAPGRGNMADLVALFRPVLCEGTLAGREVTTVEVRVQAGMIGNRSSMSSSTVVAIDAFCDLQSGIVQRVIAAALSDTIERLLPAKGETAQFGTTPSAAFSSPAR